MGIELKNGFIVNNLEQQVEYNKKNIEKHFEVDRVLADFGIRIIGRVDTAEQLPSADGYDYGDAFAVGLLEADTYDYWICTRPFEEGQGKHWFDIGPLQIVGPEGPQGPQGDKGDTGESTQWYYGTGSTDFPANAVNGDMALNSGGGVYRYENEAWVYKINIKGPKGDKGDKGDRGEQGQQGIQGEVGPTGPRGLGLVILGELVNVDALPEPGNVRRDGAYLIPVSGAKHLFAITGLGTAASPLVWEDLGEYTLTSTSGGTKYYLHNIDIYFYGDEYSVGTNQIRMTIKAISSSATPYTVGTLNAALRHKVSTTPYRGYGASHYFIFYDFYYSHYDEGDVYGVSGFLPTESSGIDFDQSIYSISRVTDSVTEL